MKCAIIANWCPATASQACELLRSAQVVAVPSETVYGLAGLAWNPEAVARIFAAKQRPSFDPLIAHVPPSWNSLDRLAQNGVVDLSASSSAWRETVKRLIQSFWPGPLTLLMPRHPRIAELVTNGLPQVAVRMPGHPIFQELLETLQAPLAAPSANRFGRISPTTAAHVAEELGEVIPFIIDGGPASVGVESTILDCDAQGHVVCLRLGAYPLEVFAPVLGYVPQRVSAQHPTLAPGMLDRHYAPHNPLALIPDDSPDMLRDLLAGRSRARIAVVQITEQAQWSSAMATLLAEQQLTRYTLSPKGNDQEAAQRLFPLLRELDSAGYELILVETPQGLTGLWPAIRDRLTRAAVPRTR